MKKLSIRKKEDSKETVMNLNNYGIEIDGEPIDGESLTSISISLDAGEVPTVTLSYMLSELEIEDIPVSIKKLTK